MNRKKKMPAGFVHKNDYPIGQFGGCPMGMYQSGPQAGGAILPAIAALYAGLKAVQPFSKAKKALEENVGESGKNKGIYKVAHKIASVGSSLGFGQTGTNMGAITYQKGVYQPITGSKSVRRQKGTGKKTLSQKSRLSNLHLATKKRKHKK